jgi:nucleoside-diphosphate-sugar epimerase
MKILITGGAGYIGSTVASACLDNGLTPVILDDFSLGRKEFVADRIAYEGDIADPAVVDRVFADHPDIEAVVHCAARIVVPESVAEPILYYRNNVCGTLALVESLLRNGCHRVVFSSSASIYSPDPDLTVDESSGLAPGSPYARTKMVDELMFEDCARATALRVLSLRYFNPVGTDPQLRTGLQSPKPTHAVGKLLEAYENGVPFTGHRRRLGDARRLGDPRLHPRLGPRRGSRAGAAALRRHRDGRRAVPGHQPRYGRRRDGPRAGRGVRGRGRPPARRGRRRPAARRRDRLLHPQRAGA